MRLSPMASQATALAVAMSTSSLTKASADYHHLRRDLNADLCIDPVLRRDDRLSTGQVKYNDAGDIFLTQTTFGYLQLQRGTVEDPGDVLWRSFDDDLSDGFGTSYNSKLQGDGHLWTFSNTEDEFIWSSQTISDGSKKYFFGLDCTGTLVQIVSETGEILFSDDVIDPDDPTDPDPTPGLPPIPDACFRPLLSSTGSSALSSFRNKRDGNVFMQQTRFGTLDIYNRESNGQFKLLWSSSAIAKDTSSDFITFMQNDGNLVTAYRRTDEVVWASETSVSDPLGSYVVGLTCDLERLQIHSLARNQLLYDVPTLIDDPAPAPSPPSDDCFIPFVESKTDARAFGSPFVRTEYLKVDGGVHAQIGFNGDLEIRRGTEDNQGELLWLPDTLGRGTDYLVKLQSNGDMVIQDEVDESYFSWTSDSAQEEDGDFEFGIKCNLEAVQIRSVPDGMVIFERPTTQPPISDVCFVTLLESDISLSTDETRTEYGGPAQAFVKVTSRGALEVSSGTPDSPVNLLWESSSGSIDSTDDFDVTLQRDSHLLLRRADTGKTVYRSNTVEESDEYFFGVTCDYTSVQIKAPDGRVVFEEPTLGTAPCRIPLFTSEDKPLESGQAQNGPEGDNEAHILMTDRGALEIRSGKYPGGSLLWESTDKTLSNPSSGDFEANLQGDSHLLIRNPSREIVFKSNTVADKGDWNFGVTCDLERVQIWSGSSIVYDEPTID